MLQVVMGKHTELPEIDAAAWLRENGLRATHGRLAIVRLLDASSIPLTLADKGGQTRGSADARFLLENR